MTGCGGKLRRVGAVAVSLPSFPPTAMTSSHLSRIAAVSLALVGLAACSDSPAAPSNDLAIQAAINAPASAPVAAPRAAVSAAVAGAADPADTLRVQFEVGPEGGVFALGRHWISFPANSICDMSQASYGDAHWNELCTPATEPVAVDAMVFVDTAGRPHVEFAQHLRFDPTQQVILHMTFDYRVGDETPDVLWKRDRASEAVDEGEVDPAMVTREGSYWMVYRRVKHFSGYIITSGRLESSLDASEGGEAGGDASLGVETGITLRRTPGLPIAVPKPLESGHVVATGRATPELP